MYDLLTTAATTSIGGVTWVRLLTSLLVAIAWVTAWNVGRKLASVAVVGEGSVGRLRDYSFNSVIVVSTALKQERQLMEEQASKLGAARP